MNVFNFMMNKKSNFHKNYMTYVLKKLTYNKTVFENSKSSKCLKDCFRFITLNL